MTGIDEDWASLPSTRTFECEDCHYTIHSFGYQDNKNVCGICQWLRYQDIPEEEKLRLIQLVRHDTAGRAPN